MFVCRCVFKGAAPWKGPKGLITWIPGKTPWHLRVLHSSRCRAREPRVAPSGLGWERSVGKQHIWKRPEDHGRALKVWTCGYDYRVRTTPLICKHRHFRLPLSSQGRGWGARTREKTDFPAIPSHSTRRPIEEFSSLAPGTKPGEMGAASRLPSDGDGCVGLLSSNWRGASGWALTLSSSAGVSHLVLHPSPKFPDPRGNFSAPYNHHHLVSPLQRWTAGPRMPPGLRRPWCSHYSVAAASGDPGRGSGAGVCTSDSSGKEQRGSKPAAVRRPRRLCGPRPRSQGPLSGSARRHGQSAPPSGCSGWAGPSRRSLGGLQLADQSDPAEMNGGRKQKPWKHFQVCNKRPICTFLLQRVRG